MALSLCLDADARYCLIVSGPTTRANGAEVRSCSLIAPAYLDSATM